MATGDVVAVKATNTEGKVGFWCTIQISGGQTITTTDGWTAYSPADPESWSDPKQMRGAVPVGPGDSPWIEEIGALAVTAFGANAQSIWAPDGGQVCYLGYAIGPIKSTVDKPAKKTASEPKKSAGKKTSEKKPRKPVDARVWAFCDDEFEMCVNSKRVLKGEGDRVASADVQLATGDLIAVKATNTGGRMGFACSIKLADGQTIASGGGWGAFVPDNPENWSQQKEIENASPVVEGDSRLDPDATVSADSQIPAQQIWAPGQPKVCYLFFVVGPVAAAK